jgi:hypothetical protein
MSARSGRNGVQTTGAGECIRIMHLSDERWHSDHAQSPKIQLKDDARKMTGPYAAMR